MSKMKLVLLDDDAYFIEMVTAYVRTSEYSAAFTVSAFTTREHGFAYIEQASEAFILLAHERFMPLPERVFEKRHGCLMIVTDLPAAADIVEYPVLCKYQPLNRLLSHVVSHYNEFTASRLLKGNRSAQVISVYSAAGGSGKTMTAMHLARELSLTGRKVFYLNMEELPTVAWIEREEEPDKSGFSRMLYYGKNDPKLQAAKVDQYKRKHGTMGFDYFPGNHEPLELAEMSSKDVEALVQSVLASGAYDFVLLDLDTSLHPRVVASLQLSHQVLWLTLDEYVHWNKMKGRLQQLYSMPWGPDWMHKVSLVVNKFSGTLSNESSGLPVAVSGYLPYIPEWKSYGRADAILVRGAFSESLAALPMFRSMVSEETGHAVV
ncbi:CobQ/CobB/MinD/ParA nucleotide binding domain protein [Paenibacillus konkukensis]|uniref:CobQ/CobB/MinD/ParA nucleotide binding domain protein n=1 Tax=Paenibacillus konkukensis TaxID=2020716 RepID=A0ABY4RJ82_9BACL|nr:hypothetical protein [Paenibacillus konkukensis]UQZ81628.1 CobQ/CobB/MinD/ParA nucleotide binding domain protein [Paenibacillus konkukensis]